MEKVDGSKVIELAHELQSLASAGLLYTKGSLTQNDMDGSEILPQNHGNCF